MMDLKEFEAAVRNEGFSEAERKTLPVNCENSAHAHLFDVHALVVEGSITLTTGGIATIYNAGDDFTMPAGAVHEERVGPQGVTYLVSRRPPE